MYRLKPYFHFFELSYQFFKKHQSISATIIGVTSFFLLFTFFSANAKADGNDSLKNIEHHFLSVVEKTPYQVEVCKKVKVDGDKTSDTLTGAIIGGIIGNNVTKDLPDGGTAGAILGGILGHMNSDAKSEIKKVCNIETRYEEVQKKIYSHSTITFWSGGKQYTLKFKK
tara:strand:- start:42 stop:548 length:507 start_codon:yes stop_codon:yes gene_type:complete